MHLYDGIDFLVAIFGLFALSEVFVFLEHRGDGSGEGKRANMSIGRITLSWKLFTTPAMALSTVLDFIAGVLPGAGASLGSFMAYSAEKKDRNGTFGKGDLHGVAAPEAGNNAAAGGALVPMLALGVPGSGTTAVLLATLLALNITPRAAAVQAEPGRGLGPDRGAALDRALDRRGRRLHAADPLREGGQAPMRMTQDEPGSTIG